MIGASLLLLAVAQSSAAAPTVQVGKTFRVGAQRVVSGSREIVESDAWIDITIHGVRTALVFSGSTETIIAPEDRKIVIFDVTVKNPNKKHSVIMGPRDPISVRLQSADAGKGYDYGNIYDADGAHPSLPLKPGDSRRLQVVIIAPAKTPTMTLGFAKTMQGSSVAWMSVVPAITKAPSHFSPNGIDFEREANAKFDETYQLEAFEMTAGKPYEIKDHGWGVLLTIKNRTRLPQKWGWQFASAKLTAPNVPEVTYYPGIFSGRTDTSWAGELPPGNTATLEYRFYPHGKMSPTGFHLEITATKRQIHIEGT